MKIIAGVIVGIGAGLVLASLLGPTEPERLQEHVKVLTRAYAECRDHQDAQDTPPCLGVVELGGTTLTHKISGNVCVPEEGD